MTEKKNSPLRQFLLYGFTVGKPPEKLGEDRGTFEDYNIRGRDLEAIYIPTGGMERGTKKPHFSSRRRWRTSTGQREELR